MTTDDTAPDTPAATAVGNRPVHLCGMAIVSASTLEPLSRSWNQIARCGDFRGHPQGPFSLNASVFEAIVSNFKATRNRRVPVDYEHKSETLDGNVAQDGAPALAWVVGLENRGTNGLWGLFEWVDAEAVDHVRTGRYMYLSPAVVFDAIDRESGRPIGPRLTSAALTNHPFLDGMAPLVASESAASEVVATTSAAANPAAPVLASLSPDTVHVPSAVGAKPKDNRVMAELVQDQDNRVMSLMKRLRAAAKMSDASDDDLMDAICQRLSDYDAMKAAEASRMRAEAETLVALRVTHGVIADDDDAKSHAVKLCLSDRGAFDALFKAREPAKVEAKAEAKAEDKPAASADSNKPSGDARALLSSEVAPKGQPGEQRETVVTQERDSREAHNVKAVALSDKLRAENPKLSPKDALVMASAQIKREDAMAALARIAASSVR